MAPLYRGSTVFEKYIVIIANFHQHHFQSLKINSYFFKRFQEIQSTAVFRRPLTSHLNRQPFLFFFLFWFIFFDSEQFVAMISSARHW